MYLFWCCWFFCQLTWQLGLNFISPFIKSLSLWESLQLASLHFRMVYILNRVTKVEIASRDFCYLSAIVWSEIRNFLTINIYRRIAQKRNYSIIHDSDFYRINCNQSYKSWSVWAISQIISVLVQLWFNYFFSNRERKKLLPVLICSHLYCFWVFL